MSEDLERLSRDLTDRGLLIEAGFVSLRRAAIAPDAPPEQVAELRAAFFAGAQHLFGSIMTMLEPGDDPTHGDLRRLDLINAELLRFVEDYKARHLRTKGSA